ncbi:hypothetical protein QQS21_012643 [Conoideocrella luteorostrata]|uniref:Uncharacterized protein n=1 Tax=Conoideocrella luteorostrata TaxID=1105319 RepID=A0AAJ0CB44_9HYPO|nr:hypothetical protein QQS21_012643 [Conoideocrella luteorostrata]
MAWLRPFATAAELPQMTCKSVDIDGFNVTFDETWLSNHTAPMEGEDETGAHPHQSAALQRYLDGQCAAADALSAITSPAPGSSDTQAELRDRVLGIIEDALFELPKTYAPALIALLKELNTRPEEDEDGAPLWRGLKSFGDSWSDSWKQPHWRKALSTRDPGTRDRRREAHLHRAFIEASCAVANIGTDAGALDSAEEGLLPLSWGYECLSDALESPDGVVWDFEVPAAAVWLRVAGRRMLEGAKRGEKSWALEREGRLWAPGPMSTARWEFWLSRLDQLRGIGTNISKAASEGLTDGRALTEEASLK